MAEISTQFPGSLGSDGYKELSVFDMNHAGQEVDAWLYSRELRDSNPDAGFIVPELPRLILGARAEFIGGKLLRSGMAYTPQLLLPEFASDGNGASPLTSYEHVDGIGTDEYLQIHVNGGAPKAEVTLRVREIDRIAQAELNRYYLEQLHGRSSFEDSVYVQDMPDAIGSLAPVVASYRAHLEAGQVVVFRNGFDAKQVSESPKYLVTHEFTSVDEQGNKIDAPRTTYLGRIAIAEENISLPGTTKRRFFGSRKR